MHTVHSSMQRAFSFVLACTCAMVPQRKCTHSKSATGGAFLRAAADRTDDCPPGPIDARAFVGLDKESILYQMSKATTFLLPCVSCSLPRSPCIRSTHQLDKTC